MTYLQAATRADTLRKLPNQQYEIQIVTISPVSFGVVSIFDGNIIAKEV